MPWDKAQVHVLTHALHYGSSVFEGIRVYATPTGSQVFRLQAHTRRLFDSAKIHRIRIPYSPAKSIRPAARSCCANNLTNGAYIRPIAFRGYGDIGLRRSPITRSTCRSRPGNGAHISATDALENGVDVSCIVVATRRAEYDSGTGQSRRQLPVEYARQPRGAR